MTTISDSSIATPERTAMRKVTTRLLATLFCVYVFNYLDRTNIGIAKLQMQPELGLSEASFGLGAGLFFVGYVLFEVPSNLILQRVGARIWITRIMVTWGLVAAGSAFVRDETTFYIMRFLLGVAEAGLVPGVILYLSQWTPQASRARAVGLFYLAVPVAAVVGAPLSGWLMSFEPFGLSGWRFMLLAEGIPCVLFAGAVYALLTDKPVKASWLTEIERNWLIDTLAREDALHDAAPHNANSTLAAARDGRVLALSAVFFAMIVPIYALSFFLPAIVSEISDGQLTTLNVGLVTAIPFAFAAVGLLVLPALSDRAKERIGHYALPALVGAGGFVLAAFSLDDPARALFGFVLGAIGCLSTLPTFWAVAPQVLSMKAQAGGIALICALGNIAGFVSPYMIALIRGEHADDAHTSNALLVVSGFLALAAILMIVVGRSLKATSQEAT